jgi:large subunit ribosomal protein L14
MIQLGTILKVADKTGVVLVQCIKVFGSSKKRIAFIGDVVLVSVQRIILKSFIM